MGGGLWCEKSRLWGAHMVPSSLPGLSHHWKLPRGTKGTGHGTYPFKSLPPAEILWILKKGKSVGGPSWGTARRPLVSFNTARHGTFLGTQEANTGWNLTWFLRWRWLAQAKTSKNPLGSSGWPPDSMFGVYLASEAWPEEQWLKPDSWMGPWVAIQWVSGQPWGVSWPIVQEKSHLEVSSQISGPLRTLWKLKVPEGLVGARPWGKHLHELHSGMVVSHRIWG